MMTEKEVRENSPEKTALSGWWKALLLGAGLYDTLGLLEHLPKGFVHDDSDTSFFHHWPSSKPKVTSKYSSSSHRRRFL
jgi:hypothetical protein